MPAPPTWSRLLAACRPEFTAPGWRLFAQLGDAWVLCPGRHTLTRLWASIPAVTRASYHAYARWVRTGRWATDGLFQSLIIGVVGQVAPDGRLVLLVDDTLVRKTGPKIDGVGLFRDMVRSALSSKLVTARGLNVVVLSLRLYPPWRGEPLALPVGVRLHRKHGPTPTDLAADMLKQVARWLPTRDFWLVADGAYSRLLRLGLPRTHVVTRLRSNAALYALPPPRRPHQRGRPRKKGERLPVPNALASASATWAPHVVGLRRHRRDRDLYARRVLWYETCQTPVLMVAARDPQGVDDELYLATSDVDAPPAQVLSLYADRWAIEESFRDLKQSLGAEDPQCRVKPGPERAVALAGWVYSAAWIWFLAQWDGQHAYWPDRPWYPAKQVPSFADVLAALRRELWATRLFDTTTPAELQRENVRDLLEVLALAA